MTIKLACVAGVLEGTTLALTNLKVSVGRERTNDIWINDLSVSRRHCVIEQDGSARTIVDLGSHNGTFVNGVPVKECTLRHGDLISIGDTVFVFLAQDDAAPTADEPETVEIVSDLNEFATTLLPFEDLTYLHPDKLPSAFPRTARLARDLGALLRISAALAETTRLRPLQEKLLDSIFEISSAERAAILLADHGSRDIGSTFGRWRDAAHREPVSVSRTIVQKVLKESGAVLCNNIQLKEEFKTTESLHAAQAHSVLCVPLMRSGGPIGAFYLDSTDLQSSFDKNHLTLLTALSSIAAIAIENVRQVEWLVTENERLRSVAELGSDIVGESPAMRGLHTLIDRVAPTNSTVLIRGESGTGKELVAKAIHAGSPRREHAFVAINCAVLNETLLESELFGHERGAFTGAVAQKKGKLELADGGTLFLDEVGELALLLQAKLLRVLQEREFERVGGVNTIRVDTRLIAATNRPLEQAIAEGKFRQDLYYRLNVVQLTVPPLRERRDDIDLLASYFVAKYVHQCKRRVTGISRNARACLADYDWPGNVRELQNAIERAVVLGITEMIHKEDLPDAITDATTSTASSSPPVGYLEGVRQAKREIVLGALDEAKGNFADAAKRLVVHPNNLHRLVRTLGLKELVKKRFDSRDA